MGAGGQLEDAREGLVQKNSQVKVHGKVIR